MRVVDAGNPVLGGEDDVAEEVGEGGGHGNLPASLRGLNELGGLPFQGFAPLATCRCPLRGT